MLLKNESKESIFRVANEYFSLSMWKYLSISRNIITDIHVAGIEIQYQDYLNIKD